MSSREYPKKTTQKVSTVVWRYVQARRDPGESFDTVLRRELGIPPDSLLARLDPRKVKIYLETRFPYQHLPRLTVKEELEVIIEHMTRIPGIFNEKPFSGWVKTLRRRVLEEIHADTILIESDTKEES